LGGPSVRFAEKFAKEHNDIFSKNNFLGHFAQYRVQDLADHSNFLVFRQI
jgi:hypothetical protein